MKAVWYEQTGPAAETLTVGTMDEPKLGASEVKVRLMASGVNPSDVKARAGTRAGGSGMPFPRIIPHSDGAGVIEAVGEGVSPARIGERVWIWNGQWRRPFGTAAQYISVPESQAILLPDNVSFAVGATLGIPVVTASHGVFSNGDVTGKTVYVSGGAGTVGRLMVQFAKIGGAFVIASARDEVDMARAKSAGADITLDFTKPNLAERILVANRGRPVDRIIEVEFGVNADTNATVIKERGNIVTYGSSLALRPELPFYPLMFKGISLEFVLVYLLNAEERSRAVDRVNDAISRQLLDIPIHSEFPLDECARAHEVVESGGREGSVVLRIN